MAGTLKKFMRFIGIEDTDDPEAEYYEEDDRSYGRDRDRDRDRDYGAREERGYDRRDDRGYDRREDRDYSYDRNDRADRADRGDRGERYGRVSHSEDVEESFPNGRSARRDSRGADRAADYVQQTGMKMIVYHPVSYEDTQNIIDSLRLKKPVIVNIVELETSSAVRILDFLSGAVYALGGRMVKVSNGIFIVTPENCDVVGNEEGEEEEQQ